MVGISGNVLSDGAYIILIPGKSSLWHLLMCFKWFHIMGFSPILLKLDISVTTWDINMFHASFHSWYYMRWALQWSSTLQMQVCTNTFCSFLHTPVCPNHATTLILSLHSQECMKKASFIFIFVRPCLLGADWSDVLSYYEGFSKCD